MGGLPALRLHHEQVAEATRSDARGGMGAVERILQASLLTMAIPILTMASMRRPCSIVSIAVERILQACQQVLGTKAVLPHSSLLSTLYSLLTTHYSPRLLRPFLPCHALSYVTTAWLTLLLLGSPYRLLLDSRYYCLAPVTTGRLTI